MSPQHLISTYSEQFVPPGGGKPAVPRPSSPSRRNNPHPRPDFLVPLPLLSSSRSPRASVNAVPFVGRPLFPPVRYLSFQETRPDNGQTRKLPRVSFIGSPATLPSAGRFQKIQSTAAGIDNQAYPSIIRQMSASNSQRRLQSTNSPTAQHNHKPQPYWRSNTLDSCAGYSCFNVVKPFQAGHFIIHPEFLKRLFCELVGVHEARQHSILRGGQFSELCQKTSATAREELTG
ncbi:unnamed protein product [Arctogadus glacialis]